MSKEEVREKAINIAMNNYLSDWDGDAVNIFNKLQEEESKNFSDIDYANVWRPFEYETIESVAYYMNVLVEEIVNNFS